MLPSCGTNGLAVGLTASFIINFFCCGVPSVVVFLLRHLNIRKVVNVWRVSEIRPSPPKWLPMSVFPVRTSPEGVSYLPLQT